MRPPKKIQMSVVKVEIARVQFFLHFLFYFFALIGMWCAFTYCTFPPFEVREFRIFFFFLFFENWAKTEETEEGGGGRAKLGMGDRRREERCRARSTDARAHWQEYIRRKMRICCCTRRRFFLGTPYRREQ